MYLISIRDTIKDIAWVLNPFFFLSFFSIFYFLLPEIYLAPFLNAFGLSDHFESSVFVSASSLWWFWTFFIAFILTTKKNFVFINPIDFSFVTNKCHSLGVKVFGVFIFIFTFFLTFKHYQTLRMFTEESRLYSHAYFYDVVYKPNKLEVFFTAGFGVIAFLSLVMRKSYWIVILIPSLLLEFASGGRSLTFQMLIFYWLVNVLICKKSFHQYFLVGLFFVLSRIISRLSFFNKTFWLSLKEFFLSSGGEFGFTKISTLLALNSTIHGDPLSYVKSCMFKILPPMINLKRFDTAYESAFFNFFPKTIWFGIGGSPVAESFYYFRHLGVFTVPLILIAYFLMLIKYQRNGHWWIIFLYSLHLTYMANFFRHGFFDLIFDNVHSFFYFMLPIILLLKKNSQSKIRIN